MAVSKHSLFQAKKSILLIYCFILLFAAACLFRHPAYNWDMLPYMGVVLSYDNTDATLMHKEVYATAKEKVPALYYNRLADPNNVYRNNAAINPEIFHAQFPFYVVKPLYTGMAFLFYKAGIPLIQATILPSVLAWFITGLVLFFWLQKYWHGWVACAGGLLLMLSPPLLNVASLSTPDALSGLLLFAALYCITEKKSITGTYVFLLLAVFARLDNILPAVCLLAVMFFAGKRERKIPTLKMSALYAILLLGWFAVSGNTRSFGWSIFFYPAFIKQLNSSYTSSNAFDTAAYLSLAKSQVATGLYFSFVIPFLFLVLCLLWNRPLLSFKHFTTEQILAIVFVAIIMIRFILQPLVTDRLYIAYYLAVAVFLVKRYSLAASPQQNK